MGEKLLQHLETGPESASAHDPFKVRLKHFKDESPLNYLKNKKNPQWYS